MRGRILAHNRILFACQKRLMEQVRQTPGAPAGIDTLARNFLEQNTAAAKEAFCNAIVDYGGWRDVAPAKLLARYQSDSESSWYRKVHDVAEW